jgi:hypothetical protein
VIDEAALEHLVEDTIRPYRGILDEDALEEMRLTLLVLFETHPVISATMAAAYPNKAVERSGERSDEVDDLEIGEASGDDS